MRLGPTSKNPNRIFSVTSSTPKNADHFLIRWNQSGESFNFITNCHLETNYKTRDMVLCQSTVLGQ